MVSPDEDYLHLKTMIETWGIWNLDVIIGTDIDITQFAGLGFNSVNYSDYLNSRQWIVKVAKNYRQNMLRCPLHKEINYEA